MIPLCAYVHTYSIFSLQCWNTKPWIRRLTFTSHTANLMLKWGEIPSKTVAKSELVNPLKLNSPPNISTYVLINIITSLQACTAKSISGVSPNPALLNSRVNPFTNTNNLTSGLDRNYRVIIPSLAIRGTFSNELIKGPIR